MNVVVLGAGALGSLYGAWFAEAGHEVVLVGRPAHAAAINASGLAVRDLGGGRRSVRLDAVADAADTPDADVVLLASKAGDTDALLTAYRGQPRAAFSVQNGARQAEPLVARFGAAAVGCVSMVGATLDAPGAVTNTFTGATYVGELPTSTPGVGRLLEEVCPAAAAVEVRDDIREVLWSKAVLAVPAMAITSLTRFPYHLCFTLPGCREAFLDLTADAAAVADAEGVTLLDLPGPLQVGTLVAMSRESALARLAEIGDHLVATGQTEVRISMLQSIESGRPLEVQAIFRDLVDRADAHGLAVPRLRLVCSLLESIDAVLRGDAPS